MNLWLWNKPLSGQHVQSYSPTFNNLCYLPLEHDFDWRRQAQEVIFQELIQHFEGMKIDIIIYLHEQKLWGSLYDCPTS